MNLGVIVVSIFIVFCNADISAVTKNCIAKCRECVQGSATLTHLQCTKHCEDVSEKDGGEITCAKLEVQDSPKLEADLKKFNDGLSSKIKSGDYPGVVDMYYTDDCVAVIGGDGPYSGKEQFKKGWIEWSEGYPQDISFSTTAYGEKNGLVWEQGLGVYPALAGSIRYMRVYRRDDMGALRIYIHMEYEDNKC